MSIIESPSAADLASPVLHRAALGSWHGDLAALDHGPQGLIRAIGASRETAFFVDPGDGTVAAALSAGLIAALRPAFARYAMARPNARSSHTVPTPQGGGIAVIAATLIAAWLGAALTSTGLPAAEWLALSTAAILLALTGAVDDIRGLGPGPRLLIQIFSVGLVIAALPDDFAVVPQLARPFERALLLLGGVWFVNLVNFMDGIDWMTVAETVPLAAAIVLLGLFGNVPALAALAGACLLGAMLGFAPSNRPVAK